jgi:preprotein translocase subunit Sec63
LTPTKKTSRDDVKERDTETVEQMKKKQPQREQEPVDYTNVSQRKRRRVMIAIVALVVKFATSGGATTNNDEYRNVYLEMLTAIGIDSDSSDEDVKQAMVAMADMFLRGVPAELVQSRETTLWFPGES